MTGAVRWVAARIRRLLDLIFGGEDTSGYYVEASSWPATGSDDDLSIGEVYAELNVAFDTYYEPAIDGLARIVVPKP